MEVTVDSLWAQAQHLDYAERIALSNLLLGTGTIAEIEQKKNAAEEIDRFFGGWNCDTRSTEEIMSQIRSARTQNSYHLG